MAEKPSPKSSLAEKELDKAQAQFEHYEANIASLTLDKMNEAPLKESEPHNKLTQNQIADSNDIYIKPFKTIACRDKFNEDYRKDWDFAKEYVYITAQNNMILNEFLQFWTKPFAGIPYEEWKIPVNKPIWVRRHVAEQIKNCVHHELVMDESKKVESNEFGDFCGQMVAKKTVQRFDAFPATKKKSIFMGTSTF